MQSLLLRDMTSADLAAVAAIETACGGSWKRSTFVGELALCDRDREYLVAESGGVVVAFAGTMVALDDVHVMNVAVDAGSRRCGVAGSLMVSLLESARDRGALRATLEVRAANRAAIGLYSKLGFAPVGIREGYYQDTGEDALIMWLHDLDGHEAKNRFTSLGWSKSKEQRP